MDKVSMASVKEAKELLQGFFALVGHYGEEAITEQADADLSQVRLIGSGLAFWASSSERTEEELAAMQRVCGSSVADRDVKYVFKAAFDDDLELIHIGKFDDKKSKFLPDNELVWARYPGDLSHIKLVCEVAETRRREFLSDAHAHDTGADDDSFVEDLLAVLRLRARIVEIGEEAAYAEARKVWEQINDDPEYELEVRIKIKFGIEFDLTSGELYCWIAKYGVQMNHLDEDCTEQIAKHINYVSEYYSNWKDGVESNSRIRSGIHGGDGLFK